MKPAPPHVSFFVEFDPFAEVFQKIAFHNKVPRKTLVLKITWDTKLYLTFRFRYGADRCKILCESPWIAPERTLSSGYHFRFGTLESALPHLLQNRPGLLRIVFDYHLWHLGIFKEFLRTQYYHQRMEAENISYLAYSWMVSRKIIFAVLFLTFAANLDKYSVKFTELIHNIA